MAMLLYLQHKSLQTRTCTRLNAGIMQRKHYMSVIILRILIVCDLCVVIHVSNTFMYVIYFFNNNTTCMFYINLCLHVKIL